MKKITAFGIVFSILILGIYARELYDFCVITLGVSNGIISALSNFFTTHPWWWSICKIGSLVCGFAAPILYFMRSRSASTIAFMSFDFSTIGIVLSLILRYGLTTNGIHTLLVSIGFMLLTVCYAGYLHSCKELVYTEKKTRYFWG